MITYKVEAGENIVHVAQQMVAMASRDDVTATFNEIVLHARKGISEEDVLNAYHSGVAERQSKRPMTYPELCDKVEAALAGRASYTVTLQTMGERELQSGTLRRKRAWMISISPAWSGVQSNTPEGAYAAFLAALLPLVEPTPGDAGADVGV